MEKHLSEEKRKEFADWYRENVNNVSTEEVLSYHKEMLKNDENAIIVDPTTEKTWLSDEKWQEFKLWYGENISVLSSDEISAKHIEMLGDDENALTLGEARNTFL